MIQWWFFSFFLFDSIVVNLFIRLAILYEDCAMSSIGACLLGGQYVSGLFSAV